MSGCDAAGFDQRLGSANLFSMAARSERRREESKILPQAADFFADGSVGEFEIGKHSSMLAEKRPGMKRLGMKRSGVERLAEKRVLSRAG
jgi:hypothetical protein